MNAVFSFWSKPYLKTGKVHSDIDNPVFIFSWIYSVNLAKKIFPKVILYTDDFGFQFLCKKLNLKFDEVNLSLNDLDAIPIYLWAYGKIITYQDQKEPFLHIDYDVFLSKPLADKFSKSDFIVESVETFKDHSLYIPLINTLKQRGYKSPIFDLQDETMFAYNAGIFGGNNLDFIKLYCLEAVNIVDFIIKNEYKSFANNFFTSILFEQSNLALCAKYYGVKPSILCDGETTAIDNGYTHLKGAKKEPDIANKISKKIFYHFPQYYWGYRFT